LDPTETAGPAWLAPLRRFVVRDDLRIVLNIPITLPGRVIREVAGVFMRFPRWTGAPFADDFGKKSAAMIEIDGEHLFPELAVLRLLENGGWSVRWVNTYSARGEIWKYLTDWRDVPRDEQKNRPIEEAEPRQVLARIAGLNKPARYAGCWDTFAWKDSDFAFLQCKRTPPKTEGVLKKEQEDWLRSALYLGDRRVSVNSFCVVQWDYE
jgi:hypothetical protein